MKKERQPTRHRLLLAAGSLLLTPVLLEVGSYAFGTFELDLKPPMVTNAEEYSRALRPDPLLFWSLAPDAVDANGVRLTNAHGLRGPAIGPKREDEYRILSLGESSTHAGRIPYESTYSATLQRLLSRVDGKRVRVINAGVPGYSLFQGHQYLAHRGLQLEPDLVLLYFGYNDFLPVSYLERQGSRGFDDAELHEYRRSTHYRVHTFLGRTSNLYRAFRNWREPGSTAEGAAEDRRPRVPEAKRRELLSAFLELCMQHEIQVVVVVPWYMKFEDHAPLLREFAREHGLLAIDLPELLRRTPRKPREEYFLDRVHPTAEGHELIAREIRNGLLAFGRNR